jgi:ribonuclease HI
MWKEMQTIREQTATCQKHLIAMCSPILGMTKELGKIYAQGYGNPKLLYACEVYSCHMSEEGIKKVDQTHRSLLRMVTGVTTATDVTDLYLEADTWPLSYEIRRLQANTWERLMRSDFQWTRGTKGGNQRLVKEFMTPPSERAISIIKESCAQKGVDMDSMIREPIVIYNDIPPWGLEAMGNITIQLFVEKGTKKGSLTKEEQKRKTELAISQLGPLDMDGWTDGSVKQNQGSAAAFLLFQDENVIASGKVATGWLGCSYTAERVALRELLRAIRDKLRTLERRCDKVLHIGAFVDCQSLLSTLLKGPLHQTDPVIIDIWKLLLEIGGELRTKVSLQHVFSHCGVVRNEMVDQEADMAVNETTMITQKQVPVAYRDIKAAIKEFLKEKWKKEVEKQQAKGTFRTKHYGVLPREDLGLTRADQALMSKIRTGYVPRIGRFERKLQPTMAESCRLCVPGDHHAGTTTSAEKYTRTCPKCQKEFPRRDTMVRHHKSKHPGEPDITLKHKCHLCIFGTAHRTKLRAHYKEKHKMEPPPIPPPIRDPSTGVTESLEHLLVCPASIAQDARKGLDLKFTDKLGDVLQTDLLTFVKRLGAIFDTKGIG